MDNTINGRTPEEIKKGLECCSTTGKCEECAYAERCAIVAEEDPRMWFGEPVMKDALAYILRLEDHIGALTEMVRQLERERDEAVEAMFLKPLSWDEAIGDDAFLEIKGDEYIDAALNRFACSRDVGANQNGFIYYTTLDDDNLKLMESDYGKTWRCWARRPTDEEREAAAWEA